MSNQLQFNENLLHHLRAFKIAAFNIALIWETADESELESYYKSYAAHCFPFELSFDEIAKAASEWEAIIKADML
jgi:hypothetical protein